MGIVVHNIVDALELFLLNHLFLLDVINLQSAHLGIVGGIDNPLAFAVECYISGVVKLDAVDILQPPLLARF